MKLKKIYTPAAHGEKPDICGVEIITPPANGEHNFSPKLIRDGLINGWLTVSQSDIVIHTPGTDVAFKINRAPGCYCTHCGATFEHDTSRARIREHIQQHHAALAMPGYEVINHYETTQR